MTTSTRVSDASTTKRVRRTKAEIQALRESIYEIVEHHRPCSGRQVYYVGIGSLWDKDKKTKDGKDNRKNANDVTRQLGVMRENGMLPWGWLTDETRRVRIDRMYDGVDDAMQEIHELYRRNLWSHQPRRVEVWAESDSTASLIESDTRALGVGLYSCRGQAGKEFTHASAVTYIQIGKPVTILYVGDWDPSGLAIQRSLHERLERYSQGAVPIEFRRLAVVADDIRAGVYQTHEVNENDKNLRKFVAICAENNISHEVAMEVEALPPQLLRDRVKTELYDLVDDATAWNATLAAEESEREILGRLIGHVA